MKKKLLNFNRGKLNSLLNNINYLTKKQKRQIRIKNISLFILIIFIGILFLRGTFKQTLQINHGNRPLLYQPHSLFDLNQKLKFSASNEYIPDSNMQAKYRWPYGSSFAVYSDGQYLFAGFGAGIRIYLINDGINMNLVSSISTPSRVLKIAKQGNYLYVANQDNGLVIYNISDIVNPQLISRVPITYAANDLEVKGNYVYLSDGWYGGSPGSYQYLFQGRFKIIDISDIQNPTVKIDWDMGGEVTGVCVKGAYAYVVYITYSSWDGTHTNLAIYDISDPVNPVGQSNIDLGSPHSYTDDMGDVAVKGTRAFVTFGVNGIQCVDISNIQAPVISQTIPLPNQYAFRIEQYDTNLVVTNRYTGLIKIGIGDITQPSTPIYYSFEGQQMDVSYNSGLIFTASERAGVRVLTDSNLSQKSHITLSHETQDIFVGNDKIITTDGTQGIKIFKKDTNELSLIGSWSNNSYMGPLTECNDYVYVAQENNVKILDISNPSSPILYDSLPTYKMPISDIIIANGKLFVTQPSKGLSVYDLTIPGSPVLIDTFAVTGTPYRIKVDSNYAYLACGEAGIRVLNISNIHSIDEVGFYDPAGIIYDLDIFNHKAYLAAGDQGLIELDIADPTGPFLLKNIPTEGRAIGISYKNFTIYLTTSFNKLTTYIETPQGQINIIGYFTPCGLRSEVFWGSDLTRPVVDEDNNIYLGCGVLGFVQLKYVLPTAPIAITSSAIGINSFGALLRGVINPNSALTTVQFDYPKSAIRN